MLIGSILSCCIIFVGVQWSRRQPELYKPNEKRLLAEAEAWVVTAEEGFTRAQAEADPRARSTGILEAITTATRAHANYAKVFERTQYEDVLKLMNRTDQRRVQYVGVMIRDAQDWYEEAKRLVQQAEALPPEDPDRNGLLDRGRTLLQQAFEICETLSMKLEGESGFSSVWRLSDEITELTGYLRGLYRFSRNSDE